MYTFNFVVKFTLINMPIFRAQFINFKMAEVSADRNFTFHLQNHLIHFTPFVVYWNEYTTELFLLEHELEFPLFKEVAPLIPLELKNTRDFIPQSKIQYIWSVSIYLEHISRDKLMGSGLLQ